MQYWIDGYNLILRQGWQNSMSLQRARERLVREVVQLGVPAKVYFDAREMTAGGPGLESPSSKVKVVFVRGETADEAILRDLVRLNAKGVTLVTDDRELRGRARKQGANTLGVDKMVLRLAKAAAPRPPKPERPADERPADRRLSSGEVEDWMQWFGFDEEEGPDGEGRS